MLLTSIQRYMFCPNFHQLLLYCMSKKNRPERMAAGELLHNGISHMHKCDSMAVGHIVNLPNANSQRPLFVLWMRSLGAPGTATVLSSTKPWPLFTMRSRWNVLLITCWRIKHSRHMQIQAVFKKCLLLKRVKISAEKFWRTLECGKHRSGH